MLEQVAELEQEENLEFESGTLQDEDDDGDQGEHITTKYKENLIKHKT